MNIPIINDTVVELNETFLLEINVPETAVRTGIIDGCDPFAPIVTVKKLVQDNDMDFSCE